MEVFDVAIIGSGPAGLTAAIYAARASLKTLVLAGEKWGGQLMLTAMVENFPGFPEGVEGPVLMEKMKKQAEKFGAKMTYEEAISITTSGHPGAPFSGAIGSNQKDSLASLQNDGFLINDNYKSKAVIIATGANTQWLGLPNEQRLIGHGVSSCAPCDAFFFKGKKVAVVGGGDAAMEEALYLTKFASEVVLIHRRDSLRASKIMQDRVLNNSKIKVLFNTQVIDVLGQDHVEGLKLDNNSVLQVDGLFVAIGHKPNDELLKGLENTPGIFIAGDVVDLKYKQAITAAGSGCQAAMDAQKWLASLRGRSGLESQGLH